MRKPARLVLAASVVAAILGTTAVPSIANAADAANGKNIALDRKKGNCYACHAFEGANEPGNIGPPLVAMKARYPDKAKLRAQIWDATKANANTMMPPFGRHQILSEKEIDDVTEWVSTL